MHIQPLLSSSLFFPFPENTQKTDGLLGKNSSKLFLEISAFLDLLRWPTINIFFFPLFLCFPAFFKVFRHFVKFSRLFLVFAPFLSFKKHEVKNKARFVIQGVQHLLSEPGPRAGTIRGGRNVVITGTALRQQPRHSRPDRSGRLERDRKIRFRHCYPLVTSA